jgi:hypothetical protein
VNAGIEGGDGLHGGVDVGGLGVVVVFDAVDGGDVFEAMLDGVEVFDGLANRLRWSTGKPSGADGGENVLDVVRALEGDFAEGRMGSMGASGAFAEDQVSILEPCTLRHRILNGKPVDPGARVLFRFGCADVVVGVQNQVVGWVCEAEDALLGRRVVFEAAVAVEVVGVMLRMTAMRGWNSTTVSSWKLETSRTDGVWGAGIDESMTGTPMLPPTCVGKPAAEDLADEGGGGGFAVGAGDGDDACL